MIHWKKNRSIKIKILLPQVFGQYCVHIQAKYRKDLMKTEGAYSIWKMLDGRMGGRMDGRTDRRTDRMVRMAAWSKVLRLGHYTRAFTLVAKWWKTQEWDMFNICHSGDNFVIAFLHVSDQLEQFMHFFYYEPPPEWHICDICHSSAIYVTSASGICDICGDIYGQHMALTFDIYTYIFFTYYIQCQNCYILSCKWILSTYRMDCQWFENTFRRNGMFCSS